MEGIDVPIAFFFFNRPDVTRLTFGAIATVKPHKLFLIADGPRPNWPGEAEKVLQARSIVENVDWPCEIFTNFSEVNLGCKRRLSSGISWVFEHVDRAIILEDDCLPSVSFFSYCREMLVLYKSDKRVFSISGSNFSEARKFFGHSFSRYSLMWGWATWADRWHEYQLEPSDYINVVFRTWWRHPIAMTYWLLVFKNLSARKLDTWDLQWILAVWRNNGLSCRPSHNLVRNIGFGIQATHTVNSESRLAVLKTIEGIKEFNSPLTSVVPSKELEGADEREWALINIRSIILMAFPWLSRLKNAMK